MRPLAPGSAAIALGAGLALAGLAVLPGPGAPFAALLTLAVAAGPLAAGAGAPLAAGALAAGCAALALAGALPLADAGWAAIELALLAAIVGGTAALLASAGVGETLAAASAALLPAALCAALPIALALLPPDPSGRAGLRALFPLSPPVVFGATLLGEDLLHWRALYTLGSVAQSGPLAYPSRTGALEIGTLAAATAWGAALIARTTLRRIGLRIHPELTPPETGRTIAVGADGARGARA
ncbi:MAG: hypothetical protein D6776_12300 [Planctomycetota bacterium]|nr:MAG: hypothetical protein D6776_12300 [Planctomycetota bacterium]